MDFGLEVERQSVRAGDSIRGRVIVPRSNKHKDLAVTLVGQEILGAENFVGIWLYSIVDETQPLGAPRESPSDTEHAFSFELPQHAPPSYASRDLRCEYHLKATIKRGPLRDVTQRLHITVLPPLLEDVSADPHALSLEDKGLLLEAQLDRTTIASGETLQGRILFSRDTPQTKLPVRVTFRLAAIEEATDDYYKHRKVLWVAENELVPDPGMEYPVAATFEFAVDKDAPFSGEWNGFRVHYGFRVAMNFQDGRQVRRSLPIRVYRRYVPATSTTLGIC